MLTYFGHNNWGVFQLPNEFKVMSIREAAQTHEVEVIIKQTYYKYIY